MNPPLPPGSVPEALFRRLEEALRGEGKGVEGRVLTIAEIYQRLVPYRQVRGELGYQELTEYEGALLRLLAGEGGHLQVLLPQVQEEFRRELRAAHPLVGLYRDYAAVEVRVASTAPSAVPSPSSPPPPAAPPPVAPSPPAPARAALPPHAACRSCSHELPRQPEVRYCPDCGAAQLPLPCAECGTVLQPAWRFCVRCGTPRVRLSG